MRRAQKDTQGQRVQKIYIHMNLASVLIYTLHVYLLREGVNSGQFGIGEIWIALTLRAIWIVNIFNTV